MKPPTLDKIECEASPDADLPIALFKVGPREYMEKLLHEGLVYMNTPGYFAKSCIDVSRHDPDEGTAYCQNGDGAILKMEDGGNWHTLGTISGAIRIHDNAIEAMNIYSLHAKMQRDYGTPFRLEALGLGDSYVIFFDANEFMRRLELAVTNAGHEFSWRPIEYVDRQTFTGPMGEFTKFREKSAEQEVRVVVKPGTGSPLSFRLGNLSDIGMIGSTTEHLLLDPKPAPTNRL